MGVVTPGIELAPQPRLNKDYLKQTCVTNAFNGYQWSYLVVVNSNFYEIASIRVSGVIQVDDL